MEARTGAVDSVERSRLCVSQHDQILSMQGGMANITHTHTHSHTFAAPAHTHPVDVSGCTVLDSTSNKECQCTMIEVKRKETDTSGNEFEVTDQVQTCGG